MLGRPQPLDAALSERMSRVRRRDTSPEIELRRALHRRRLRYRVDVPALPDLRSRADVVFRPAKVAVYVDGCFWHGCPSHGALPKNNRDWWRAKLAATVERDRKADSVLASRGWISMRIWEHEDPELAADAIERVINTRRLELGAQPNSGTGGGLPRLADA